MADTSILNLPFAPSIIKWVFTQSADTSILNLPFAPLLEESDFFPIQRQNATTTEVLNLSWGTQKTIIINTVFSDTRFTSLVDNVTALSNAVQTNSSAVANLTSSLDLVSQDLINFIDSQSTTNTTFQTNIDTLTEDTLSLAGQVSTLGSALSENVSSLSTDLSVVQNQANTNTVLINNLSETLSLLLAGFTEQGVVSNINNATVYINIVLAQVASSSSLTQYQTFTDELTTIMTNTIASIEGGDYSQASSDWNPFGAKVQEIVELVNTDPDLAELEKNQAIGALGALTSIYTSVISGIAMLAGSGGGGTIDLAPIYTRLTDLEARADSTEATIQSHFQPNELLSDITSSQTQQDVVLSGYSLGTNEPTSVSVYSLVKQAVSEAPTGGGGGTSGAIGVGEVIAQYYSEVNSTSGLNWTAGTGTNSYRISWNPSKTNKVDPNITFPGAFGTLLDTRPTTEQKVRYEITYTLLPSKDPSLVASGSINIPRAVRFNITVPLLYTSGATTGTLNALSQKQSIVLSGETQSALAGLGFNTGLGSFDNAPIIGTPYTAITYSVEGVGGQLLRVLGSDDSGATASMPSTYILLTTSGASNSIRQGATSGISITVKRFYI